jgi:hypothetical protein
MINLGWLILSIFILIIILMILNRKFNFEKDKFDNIITTLIFSLIGLIIISFLMSCFREKETETIIIDANIEIENLLSLNDSYDSNISGKIQGGLTFFYGEIRESKDLYYRVLIGDDKKGYAIKDIEIKNNVRLFFVDNNFRVEYHYDIIGEDYIPNWYYGGLFKKFNGYKEYTKLNNCKIYLPKNAI